MKFVITAILAGLVVFLIAPRAGAVTIDAGCNSKYAISSSANGQVIENLTVRNAREAVIYVTHADVVIRNVTVEEPNCAGEYQDQYAAGIACWGCSRLTVEDSTIRISRKYGNGIWVKNALGPHRIVRNTIEGGFDGIGGEPEDTSTGNFGTVTVEGNTISGCWDDGIQVEGKEVGTSVSNNTVTGCGTGIAVAPFFGNVLLEGNTLRNMRSDAPQGNRNCFKVGDGGSGTLTLRNNTCATTGDGMQQSNAGLGYAFDARDNCFNVTNYNLEFGEQPRGMFDGNTYGTEGRFKWNGSVYGTLSSFRTATGQESTGQNGTCTNTPTLTSTLTATPVGPTPIVPTPTFTPTQAPPTAVPTLTPTNTPTFEGRRCRYQIRNTANTGWTYLEGTVRNGACVH